MLLIYVAPPNIVYSSVSIVNVKIASRRSVIKMWAVTAARSGTRVEEGGGGEIIIELADWVSWAPGRAQASCPHHSSPPHSAARICFHANNLLYSTAPINYNK